MNIVEIRQRSQASFMAQLSMCFAFLLRFLFDALLVIGREAVNVLGFIAYRIAVCCGTTQALPREAYTEDLPERLAKILSKNMEVFVKLAAEELVASLLKNRYFNEQPSSASPSTSSSEEEIFVSANDMTENQDLNDKCKPEISVHHCESSQQSPDHNLQFSIEDFRCIRLLDSGHFGQVFVAENKENHEKFAIKKLKRCESQLTKNMYDHEKRILEALSKTEHPFVVKFFSGYETTNNLYFVLEYVVGGCMSNILDDTPLSEDKTRFYAACIVLGVQFLHEQKIMHRDLKLENILVGADGYIKITDFGLSKEGVDFDDIADSYCGTPCYSAPELLLGNPYTRAVDWWAVGILIYRMLVGHLPFKAKTVKELLLNILKVSEPYPDFLSVEAMLILFKLLCRIPSERLGFGERGAEQVKKEIFLYRVNWDGLLSKRVKPPFLPINKS